ncbi:MAG TPA: DNA repair exonuclease [Candidatus Limnocylindrales bacterium]|jgi:DNA repair exonuclease SbcCD nuclease subunit
MLRLVHTADVHIGARHAALGDQASVLRERQFAAFRSSVDLAIAEKVDLFLVAGDLFDSNTQPRRSVERVAMEISRLREAGIRSVIIPGTHDVYDRASIFRAYDLPRMAGNPPGEDWVTILTPSRPDAHLETCDVVVHGRVFSTKRAPHSPLLDLRVADDTRATWHIGLVHAAIAIPGKTDGDDVVVSADEIGSTGLDYLALGHWHSTQQGKSGKVSYAYAGAPEPTAIDQAGAGSVLLVTLDDSKDPRSVKVEGRRVGRTSFESLEIDAASIGSQPALVERLTAKANPDLVLDARIIGVRPDDLDLHIDELEEHLRSSFLRVRVRDHSMPPLTEGTLPPPDTIAGAFIRDTEARVAELEAADRAEEAAELRDVLRLGRLLLAGHEVSL